MKAKKITIISTLAFALFICITAFTTSTKKVILNPQEQDLGGWYADGVRIDTLKCYGFKNLQLVVPYNAEWSAYSQLSVNIFADNMPVSYTHLINFLKQYGYCFHHLLL